MIATPEAHGKSLPDDIAVVIRFSTGSGKPYIYFANSVLDIKVGDTVIVNTSSKPGAAWQNVEVIDVIHDFLSLEGNHKRIVRVHQRSEARKLESPVGRLVYPFLTGNGAPGHWPHQSSTAHTISSASAQPQNLPKETTMIKLENRTYLNGVDAASLTDDQLFELVIKTEADIEHLNGIEHKSEKVKLKIEQMRKSIRELNAYIDLRP